MNKLKKKKNHWNVEEIKKPNGRKHIRGACDEAFGFGLHLVFLWEWDICPSNGKLSKKL